MLYPFKENETGSNDRPNDKVKFLTKVKLDQVYLFDVQRKTAFRSLSAESPFWPYTIMKRVKVSSAVILITRGRLSYAKCTRVP